MTKKEILKNEVNHYINRLIYLQEEQKKGIHDYSKSINYYIKMIDKKIREIKEV